MKNLSKYYEILQTFDYCMLMDFYKYNIISIYNDNIDVVILIFIFDKIM